MQQAIWCIYKLVNCVMKPMGEALTLYLLSSYVLLRLFMCNSEINQSCSQGLYYKGYAYYYTLYYYSTSIYFNFIEFTNASFNLLCNQASQLLPNTNQMEVKERIMTKLFRHESQVENFLYLLSIFIYESFLCW